MLFIDNFITENIIFPHLLVILLQLPVHRGFCLELSSVTLLICLLDCLIVYWVFSFNFIQATWQKCFYHQQWWHRPWLWLKAFWCRGLGHRKLNRLVNWQLPCYWLELPICEAAILARTEWDATWSHSRGFVLFATGTFQRQGNRCWGRVVKSTPGL